ncbi:MAG: hypothetical protein R6U44_00540 [Archaeoglobaceae archaeon]
MKLELLISVVILLFIVNACNAQPNISINDAGNEDEASFGTDTSKHFYRNGTWQDEDWIHINATIIGATSAWVEFKNQSGWYNHSMTNLRSDIWTVTIEDNPEWMGYTFNIHAEDSNEGTARKKWLYYDYEDSWGVEEDYRKYIGLGANQQNFSYEQFYQHDVIYRSEQINSRVLKQEQPTDGTVHDTDLMFYRQSSGPQETWCDLFVAMFLGESLKVDNVVIDNIYVHTWWNTTDGELEVNWYKEKDPQISGYAYDSYTTDTNSSKHTANLSSDGFTHEHYNLEAKKWDVSSHAFEDNEINLLRLKFSGALPSIISTDSYRSFVIFNLPDNSTLQDQDSDGDGLNDYEELYVYHTDPFDSDTDNDSESDGDDNQPLDPGKSDTTTTPNTTPNTQSNHTTPNTQSKAPSSDSTKTPETTSIPQTATFIPQTPSTSPANTKTTETPQESSPFIGVLGVIAIIIATGWWRKLIR